MADMTRQEFAELRLEAHWRSIDTSYGRLITGNWGGKSAFVAEMLAQEPLVPPPAGSWLQVTYEVYPPRKWHRFEGDLAWRPAFHGVTLYSVDGVYFSQNHVSVRLADDPPTENVCRRCSGANKRPISRPQ